MKPLTAKQEAFCRAYVADGLTAAEAYRRAYKTDAMKPETVRRKAHDVMRNGNVSARIETLIAGAAKVAQVTREGHLSDLLDLRNRAAEAGDYGPAVRAEIARAQAAGLLVERREVTHSGRVVFTIPKNGRDGR